MTPPSRREESLGSLARRRGGRPYPAVHDGWLALEKVDRCLLLMEGQQETTLQWSAQQVGQA